MSAHVHPRSSIVGGRSQAVVAELSADVRSLAHTPAVPTSGAPQTTRIDILRNVTGGVPKLDTTTVLDDGAGDVLLGNLGLNWFRAGTGDRLPDQQTGEEVD
jgi:hypothetical protein